MNQLANSIDILFTPKQKLTILVAGGGMAGCDVVKAIVTKGPHLASGNNVPTYSEVKGRKIFNLAPIIRCGVIVLKGHHSRKFFESQTGRFIMDGRGGRFYDADHDGGVALLEFLRENLLLHTIENRQSRFVLLGEHQNSFERPQTDPDFHEKLMSVLGEPACSNLAPPVAAAPPRKSILTDAMKTKLQLAMDAGTTAPLYKIFSPEGAGTWLLCSLEEDGDTLWAVCDLGHGVVEYGTVSLTDLETTRTPMLKLHMERDLHFTKCTKTVSELLSQDSLSTY